MLRQCCAVAALVLMTGYVLWLEFRVEPRCIDRTREQIFEELTPTCLRYLRRTKERPIWRLSWICGVLSSFFLTTIYCLSPGLEGLGACSFVMLSFLIAFFSGYSALSYYTWHILCPNGHCFNYRSSENVMSEERFPP